MNCKFTFGGEMYDGTIIPSSHEIDEEVLAVAVTIGFLAPPNPDEQSFAE